MGVEFVQYARSEQLKRNWSSCFRCPLSLLRTKTVLGAGDLNARIMLIGEAPGKEEDIEGLPFVGRYGEMLDKILASVGLDRSKIYITNVCACRPKSKEEGRDNRAPVVEEIASCRPRLIEEIEIVKPQIVVLCGNTPLFWATGLKGISKYRGRLDFTLQTPSHVVSCVFATYHPAALFHGSESQIVEKKWAVYKDWQSIKEATLEQQQSPQAEKQ